MQNKDLSRFFPDNPKTNKIREFVRYDDEGKIDGLDVGGGIIDQDLNDPDFVPVKNTYYRHTGVSSYPITGTIVNGSFTGPDRILADGSATIINITYDEGYYYPVTLVVSGATPNYNPNTGVLQLTDPTGPVEITGECQVKLRFSISPVTDDRDLLGKTAADLQDNVVIEDNEISGVSKYVTGYTGFSGIVEEQSGNYLALVASSIPATMSVAIVFHGTNGDVLLDSDRTIVIRLTAGRPLSFTATYNQQVIDLTLSTDELTLAEESGGLSAFQVGEISNQAQFNPDLYDSDIISLIHQNVDAGDQEYGLVIKVQGNSVPSVILSRGATDEDEDQILVLNEQYGYTAIWSSISGWANGFGEYIIWDSSNKRYIVPGTEFEVFAVYEEYNGTLYGKVEWEETEEGLYRIAPYDIIQNYQCNINMETNDIKAIIASWPEQAWLNKENYDEATFMQEGVSQGGRFVARRLKPVDTYIYAIFRADSFDCIWASEAFSFGPLNITTAGWQEDFVDLSTGIIYDEEETSYGIFDNQYTEGWNGIIIGKAGVPLRKFLSGEKFTVVRFSLEEELPSAMFPVENAVYTSLYAMHEPTVQTFPIVEMGRNYGIAAVKSGSNYIYAETAVEGYFTKGWQAAWSSEYASWDPDTRTLTSAIGEVKVSSATPVGNGNIFGK